MSLGAPTIDVAGLADLDRLLKALGLRRTCSDEPPPAEEVHHAVAVASDCFDQTAHQLAIALDRPVLNGMTSSDRNAAVRRLARLLMEAAGVDPKEIGDDDADPLRHGPEPEGGRVCAPVYTDPVQVHLESQRRQYDLVDEARQSGEEVRDNR